MMKTLCSCGEPLNDEGLCWECDQEESPESSVVGTFVKLKTDEWGVRIPDATELENDVEVLITKQSGRQVTERVDIFWVGIDRRGLQCGCGRISDLTEEEIAAVHADLRYLAERCDGARSLDHQGFNGVDTHFGKDLAAQDSLSQGQAKAARGMLMKYVGQLSKREL